MSDAIHWVIELAIKDGQLDAFKALMTEMVEATQANETGATHYEWYISDDEKTCHIYERYVDSAATMTDAPARAKPWAMPRPMPPLPPVTTATRPERSNKSMAPSPPSVECTIPVGEPNGAPARPAS